MPHSILGVPAVLCPSTGYLAGSLAIGLAAAYELRAGAGAAAAADTGGGGGGAGTAVRQWIAVVWTMPGFLIAMTLNPFPDGSTARFLSATALGAAGNAALLALAAHALGLG
ncbi:hypothetical protein GCM10018790_43510 [Kitasatospora xanthocidica]|uniref:hypothetical protein n=1 Tax=Kitasatospora xanthocidica TaxID=83382 RepID=UPI001672F641|nr:hypothetical protein [Kitasatospora xanthocidica]GHF60762.1 hypothetical protein GCM10018790_43510 [Kitasatospora xanthocidica]